MSALALFVQQLQSTYLRANVLAAILAFDGMLDDRIACHPFIKQRNQIECDTHADEIKQLVQESSSLFQSIYSTQHFDGTI